MDIIEITRMLGHAIQQDERFKTFNQAKKKSDEDDVLQGMIGQFNLLRMQLNEEVSKEENKDQEKIKKLNADLRKCYADIMINENMLAYNNAKGALDEMTNRINGIIALCLQGENPDTCEPSSCSGSCSSCHGCH